VFLANARAQCCHLWQARHYIILLHYLISGTIFEKKVTGPTMRVLIASINLSETCIIRSRIDGDMIKSLYQS
jgi:hypothetical protein